MYWPSSPSGIVVDSVGNVYISSYFCNWVTKWAPNANSATVAAGSSSGTSGSDSLSLIHPYNLALDEANSWIYVADRYNHRIQRFVLGGSGVGVTVAGGNGQGSAANQLNNPIDIYRSRFDGSIYIADSSNNRVQKWGINATSGITVAGSPNGAVGQTSYLMSLTYSLAVDYDENYLYVSDSDNSRIQRFSLH
jgi:DNA-binding beta-propeller fold protein YncE